MPHGGRALRPFSLKEGRTTSTQTPNWHCGGVGSRFQSTFGWPGIEPDYQPLRLAFALTRKRKVPLLVPSFHEGHSLRRHARPTVAVATADLATAIGSRALRALRQRRATFSPRPFVARRR